MIPGISKKKYNQDWMDKELAKQTLQDIKRDLEGRELSQEEKDRIIDEYLDSVGCNAC